MRQHPDAQVDTHEADERESVTRRYPAYLLLLPQLVLLVIVSAFPLAFLFRLAMLKTDFIATTWVGLGNFGKLFHDRTFGIVMVNSLIYITWLTGGGITIAVFFALLAYDLPKTIRSYLRVSLYLPSLTAGLIISTVWRWIWHPSAGLANWLLSLVGLGPVWWFGSRWTGMFAISCIIILGGVGFTTMVLLAAILSITPEVLDAARIDGASPWQTRLQIVLPSIAPTVALLTTLALMGNAQMWETVMMTTSGGPDHGTATLMFDIFYTAFLQHQFGYGSAKTVVLIALILVLALLKRKAETWGQ